MGCTVSNESSVFMMKQDVQGQDEDVLNILFQTLRLSEKEVNVMYHHFCLIDSVGRGYVLLGEVLEFYKMQCSNGQDFIFSLFCEGSGKEKQLHFLAFVCALWNFLSLSREHLGVIGYIMRDSTAVQRLNYVAIRDVIEIIHGKKVDSSPPLHAMYTHLKKYYPAQISISDFCQWAEEAPSFLNPVLKMQYYLRRRVIGERSWRGMESMRMNHATFAHLDSMKRLMDIVQSYNKTFHKREEREAEQRVLDRRRSSLVRNTMMSRLDVNKAMSTLNRDSSGNTPSTTDSTLKRSQHSGGDISDGNEATNERKSKSKRRKSTEKVKNHKLSELGGEIEEEIMLRKKAKKLKAARRKSSSIDAETASWSSSNADSSISDRSKLSGSISSTTSTKSHVSGTKGTSSRRMTAQVRLPPIEGSPPQRVRKSISGRGNMQLPVVDVDTLQENLTQMSCAVETPEEEFQAIGMKKVSPKPRPRLSGDQESSRLKRNDRSQVVVEAQ